MPVAFQNEVKPADEASAAKGGKSGGLRSDLKRFTRERILQAALSSFQEIGFKETTVERIVDLAGTTAPTFYRHFAGKDELLPSLQEHLEQVVQACLNRMTPADIRDPQTLTRWIGDYMTMWGEVHRLCKAFWDGASLGEEMLPSTFMRMFYTGDTLERLLPQADVADLEERKLRLGLLMLMLDRLAYLVSAAPDDVMRDRLTRTFSEMMWRSVFGALD